MKIESQKSTVNAPIDEVFKFLQNTENLYELLPKEEVKEFKGNQTECSFKVQGGITISLKQEKLEVPQKITLVSGEKSPFPFQLIIELSEKENGTEGHILFDGEVNAFLKMMVKKPLTNLFNYMSSSLKNKYA